MLPGLLAMKTIVRETRAQRRADGLFGQYVGFGDGRRIALQAHAGVLAVVGLDHLTRGSRRGEGGLEFFGCHIR